MKKLSCWLILVLTLGCSRAAEIDLDRGDFVTYGYGGGELGAAWSEIVIRGDGYVEFRLVQPYDGEWPQEETTGSDSLSDDATRDFFERVVDAGLFSVESTVPLGADVPVTRVKAVIAGREVRAHLEGTYDRGFHRVVKELFAAVAPLQQSESDAGR